MLIASTPMGLTHVLADRDIPEMGSTAQISMSVLRIPFFVMKTLTAQTPMDLTLVLAERDSQAMDPPVQISTSA